MRVNRLELIDQITRIIDQRSEQSFKDHEEAVQKEHDREADHVERTGRHWATFAARVLQRTHAGQAVLKSDLPPELGSLHSALYDAREPKRQWPQVAELSRLRELLKASPDETISLASLERAGFTLGKVLK